MKQRMKLPVALSNHWQSRWGASPLSSGPQVPMPRTLAYFACDQLLDPPEWELYDLQVDPVEFHNRDDNADLGDLESRLKL
jgi:hypothetical protein